MVLTTRLGWVGVALLGVHNLHCWKRQDYMCSGDIVFFSVKVVLCDQSSYVFVFVFLSSILTTLCLRIYMYI